MSQAFIKNSTQDASQKIDAIIERVTFKNEENNWSVVRVVSCMGKTPFTVTGKIPPMYPGEKWTFYGVWSQHKQFGRQFVAERTVAIRPSGREELIRYLSSGFCKGIGEKTAKKIVLHFGEQTLKILDEKPERLFEVKKLPKKIAHNLIDLWMKRNLWDEIRMFLLSHELPQFLVDRVVKKYGEKTIELVSENPYRLAMEIKGIGFLTADTLALKLGIALDSKARVEAAIYYVLREATLDGHCYLTQDQVIQNLEQVLKISKEKILSLAATCIAELNLKGIVYSENIEQGVIHFARELFEAEVDISSKLENLLRKPMPVDEERLELWLEKFNRELKIPLTEDQKNAVRASVMNRVFILTGGPGVGKTTTANSIIRYFLAHGRKVALCAPTGRAAQRLSEVSGQEAKTIHRLLGVVPGMNTFTFNENYPLPFDVIIVDESSMIDVELAASLLRAVSLYSQIVFIGDADQLPSVGAGNFLRDLISSQKIPLVKLDKVFRQAEESAIIRNAHLINKGMMPLISDEKDFKFITVKDKDSFFLQLKYYLMEFLPEKIQENFLDRINSHA